MRNPLVLLLALVPFMTTDVGRAGPHAGGTLLVHSLDQEYSVGEMYCDVDAPASCEAVDTRVESSGPSVWVVYGAFIDAESPRLRGIEFGVTYDPGIEVIAHGSCADLELSQPGWPASGTGTIIVWFGEQSGQLIPAYWFAGYLASLEVANAFELGPHPENGGHFGDGSVVPVLDEIAGYGVLGFGVEGVAPCPEVRTFTIRADGTGDVPTIQDALDVAATGSVIQLEDGVYRGPGNRDLDLHHTTLTLCSISGNPEACVIDCEGRPGESHRGVRMRRHEDTGSLVSGIKFINGYIGPEMNPDVEGAAIKIDIGGSMRIANCIFENCVTSNSGGAVDAGGLRVKIEDCVFVNNRSLGYGGGGFSGGGEILMKNCRFEGNDAPVEGGGAWFTNATLEMENCTFVGNKAAFGGGMVAGAVTATIRGTTWFDNRAVQSGGGLYCREGSLVVEEATFSNNRGPRGGAIAVRASGSTDLSLRRSIVAFNEGESSIYCGTGRVELRNCDVWSAAVEAFVGCLTEGWEERGNFSADPLFCDRASADLRLHENSPCAVGFGRDPIGAWPVGCGSRAGAGSIAGALAQESPDTGVDASESGSRPSLDQQRDAAPILRASPNPFRAETTIELAGAGASSPILLEIFDLSGRLVRRVEAEPASGEARFEWDGRDETGRSAPAGTYFARAIFGSHTLSLRIVRMG